MQPPKSIRVLGIDYSIRFLPTGHPDTAEYEEYWIGRMTCRRPQICINSDLPLRNRETLLHEILHAVDEAVSAKLTEDQVSSISRGLYAVMLENPTMVQFIMEGYDARTE